jgi:hypothetical protein
MPFQVLSSRTNVNIPEVLGRLHDSDPPRYQELTELAKTGDPRALDALAYATDVNPTWFRDVILANQSAGVVAFLAAAAEQHAHAKMLSTGLLPKPSMEAPLSAMIEPLSSARGLLYGLYASGATVSAQAFRADLALAGASEMTDILLQQFLVAHELSYRGRPETHLRAPTELTKDQLATCVRQLDSAMHRLMVQVRKTGDGEGLSRESLFAAAGSLGFRDDNPFGKTPADQLAQAAVARVAKPIERDVAAWQNSRKQEVSFQDTRRERIADIEALIFVNHFESPAGAEALRWALHDILLLKAPRPIYSGELSNALNDARACGSVPVPPKRSLLSILAGGVDFAEPRPLFSDAAIVARYGVKGDSVQDIAKRREASFTANAGVDFESYRTCADRPSVRRDEDEFLPVGITAFVSRS